MRVVELFTWLGYAYFWYRVLIYQPKGLGNLFKTEITLDIIKKKEPRYYSEHNLVAF